MKRLHLLTWSLMTVCLFSCSEKQRYSQDRLTLHDKEIDRIIAGMSLDEKVAMLHGKDIMSSMGIPRLGIEDIHYADGPFGVREELTGHFQPLNWTCDSATYYPTGSALAATWSREMAYIYGHAIGEEARLRGKDIMLGPAINLQRLPVSGRAYEYLSEDPLLNGVIATAYTRGMQDAGTAVCLKHFALNNQETERGSVNVVIDERPMRELYLRAFEMAVKEGGAMAVMPAYNRVNGFYCSEQNELNNRILRDEWGFKGLTVSDWGGTHSTMGAALGGLDVEMPSDAYLNAHLADSVRSGSVDEAVVDEKVRHILRVRMAIERLPEDKLNCQTLATPEHLKVAYEVASRSIALLKNEPMKTGDAEKALPLKPQQIKKIAVIGQNAVAKTASGGMGAGVKTPVEITPLEGLQQRLAGSGIAVEYAPAYLPFKGRFRRGDREAADYLNQAVDTRLLQQAVLVASDADVVLFFAGTNKSIETEGSDREDIKLPVSQDDIIKKLAEVNPNLITVVVSGGPCDLKFADRYSKAVVQAWWNGSQGGLALADVLLGKIAPSGKLPFTYPNDLSDSPAFALHNFPFDDQSALDPDSPDYDVFAAQFRPDVVGQQTWQANFRETHYSEGMLVGYRWYDTEEIPVRYAFGHGLSYVDFEYGKFQAQLRGDAINVSFVLSNRGDMAAEEVPQIYVRRPDAEVDYPDKELKAFDRIRVEAGQSVRVFMQIPLKSLCYWNKEQHDWVLEPGRVELLLGGASDDIRQKVSLSF